MPPEKQDLIRELSKQHATNVAFRHGFISLTFDSRRLRNRAVKKRVHVIADWSRGKKEVYYDKHVKERDILPLLVHETIEKYVTEKYSMDMDKESHKIAQAVERRFIRSRRKWENYEKRINRLWEKVNNGEK